MNSPTHEQWQDEAQREPRTILEALQSDDKSQEDEDFLDNERGVWGPTE